MNKQESNNLLGAIRSNTALLESCSGHRFGEMPDNWREIRPLTSHKLSCSLCEGQMTVRNIVLYRDGYAANGGNPDDVLSGMNKP